MLMLSGHRIIHVRANSRIPNPKREGLKASIRKICNQLWGVSVSFHVEITANNERNFYIHVEAC